MSNEDRIKGWRARRKNRDYAVGEGVAAWRLDLAALFDAKSSPSVVLKQMLARLQGERHDNVAARRAVYEAMQAELEEEGQRRGVSDTIADFARRRLRIFVRLMEQDIRAGVDITAPGYVPAALAAEDARLTAAGMPLVPMCPELVAARDAR